MTATTKILSKTGPAKPPKRPPVKRNDFAGQMKVAHEVIRENRQVLKKLAE